ncbi:MAG: DUF3152 domain-containing protein [Acidimicrobiales bacterium]
MLIRFAALLTIAAVAVGACGDDAELATESSPQATEPTSAVTTAAAPATTPQVSESTATVASTTTVESTTTTPLPTSSSSSPVPASTGTTSVDVSSGLGGSPADAEQVVRLRFESRIGDVSAAELRDEALVILNDERGWPRAGFTFVADDASPMRVVLAEGAEVDQLCLPLVTYSRVSCQNGPVVALNADRWRSAVGHWDAAVADYRGYLVNHEVGHLLGQRHPRPRCPVGGRPAGVMEQQTAGLEGCIGNAWPRPWEIELAAERPVVYAPLPDWGPDPVPANRES